MSLSERQIEGQYLDGLLGCGVCGDDDPATHDISRHHANEDGTDLQWTEVIGILHLCDCCRDLLLAKDWAGLCERSGR